MTWSLVLLSICEIAREEASVAKKRLERQAEKDRENEAGDSLATQAATISPQTEEELSQTSFNKLWSSNVRWAKKALADAVEYAKENEPRPSEESARRNQDDEISTLFYGSLWPSLVGRGWKETENADGKIYTYENNRVSRVFRRSFSTFL